MALGFSSWPGLGGRLLLAPHGREYVLRFVMITKSGFRELGVKNMGFSTARRGGRLIIFLDDRIHFSFVLREKRGELSPCGHGGRVRGARGAGARARAGGGGVLRAPAAGFPKSP